MISRVLVGAGVFYFYIRPRFLRNCGCMTIFCFYTAISYPKRAKTTLKSIFIGRDSTIHLNHAHSWVWKVILSVYAHCNSKKSTDSKTKIAKSCAIHDLAILNFSYYISQNANAAIPNITQRNPITTSIGLNIILTADQ